MSNNNDADSSNDIGNDYGRNRLGQSVSYDKQSGLHYFSQSESMNDFESPLGTLRSTSSEDEGLGGTATGAARRGRTKSGTLRSLVDISCLSKQGYDGKYGVLIRVLGVCCVLSFYLMI